MDFHSTGRWLIVLGVGIALVGTLLLVFGKIPFMGRLPGDIVIKRDNVTFYFPVVTCIVISLVLTLLGRFFGRH